MPPAKRRALGNMLRRAREQQGLGVRELAGMAKIDPSEVVRIEQGEVKTPLALTLHRLATVLGLDETEMYSKTALRPDDLPPMGPYLRTKYGKTLSATALDELEVLFESLAEEHGLGPGPDTGADEGPPSSTRRTTNKKGGKRATKQTTNRHTGRSPRRT